MGDGFTGFADLTGYTHRFLPILLVLQIYPKKFLASRDMGSTFTGFTDFTDLSKTFLNQMRYEE